MRTSSSAPPDDQVAGLLLDRLGGGATPRWVWLSSRRRSPSPSHRPSGGRVSSPRSYPMRLSNLNWAAEPATNGHVRKAASRGVGAGDGIRTRDILLGKQALCQLSYSRSERSLRVGPASWRSHSSQGQARRKVRRRTCRRCACNNKLPSSGFAGSPPGPRGPRRRGEPKGARAWIACPRAWPEPRLVPRLGWFGGFCCPRTTRRATSSEASRSRWRPSGQRP